MGVIYESIGEYTIAMEHYKEALKISVEVGHKRNQSIHLGKSGIHTWASWRLRSCNGSLSKGVGDC